MCTFAFISKSNNKALTARYYRDVILKKIKKYFHKRCFKSGFGHVRLLHYNATSHTSELGKIRLPFSQNPLISQDLAPWQFFQNLKSSHLVVVTSYKSCQSLGSVLEVYQYQRTVMHLKMDSDINIMCYKSRNSL